MDVAHCAVPAESAIDRDLIDAADFTDIHRVPLSRGDASVTDLFFAIFGHHPAWLKAVLVVRHRVGAWFGLEAARTGDLMHPRRSVRLEVGQTIGPWPIFHLSDDELVAGRDNRHLDFRLSILKHGNDGPPCAVVSTVCHAHNGFGRTYLRVIAPFHTWGMRRLLHRAAKAGRL